MTDKHEQHARELLAKQYQNTGENWAVWGILNLPLNELTCELRLAIIAIIAALELRASNQNATKLPKIHGVSRDEQCPNCVIVWLGHDATDDQVRAIHDKLRAAESEAAKTYEIPTSPESDFVMLPSVSEDDLALCDAAAMYFDLHGNDVKSATAYASAIRRLVQSVRDNNK